MERLFSLTENKTNVRTEVIAGITTFLTMSYIIFVQPSILSIPMNIQSGGDVNYFGSVMMATCLAAAIATFVMAFLANYPIALAPGMGQNVYFAFIVCLGMGIMWQTALGAVFIAGTIFLLLGFVGFREKVIDAIPKGLKLAISGGIGLLIAMVGLQYAGIIVDDPAVLVRLGNLKAPWVVLSLVGVLIIGVLMARKVRGAILIGMIGTAILGTFISGGMHQGEADKLVQSQGGIFAAPPSIAPTIFKLDLASFFKSGSNFWALWEIVFIFLILDLFDTIGTLIGVGHSAGLLTEDGKLPRAGKALISDAIGTVTGAALGTSTVTSYIESSTGVAAGGRTGLANIVTGCLFLLAIFFEPLIKMVGGGYNIALEGDPVMKYPIIAGPLIIVGSLMMKGLRDVDWDDHSIAISAFITVIIMPLTFSISTGISFGFITYTLINLLSGKGKDVHWLMYVISVVFLFRYIWVG
jgi:AGZA family xanthine/uracil permease-like MFS transporter